MNPQPYDKTSIRSIFERSWILIGKTLVSASAGKLGTSTIGNKGHLGNLVERHIFDIEPLPTSKRPDFAEAGLELKVTGVLRGKRGYVAKERLVLSMIDYEEIIHESWETSTLLKKCGLILMLCYQYDKDVNPEMRRFVLRPLLLKLSDDGIAFEPSEASFVRDHAVPLSDDDLAVIRRDWETIRGKVLEGKAHELSEGDTYYLGACRKGSGGEGEKPRRQPNSSELAKARAFALKQGFVNMILESNPVEFSSLGVSGARGFAEATRERFNPYIGRRVDEIALAVGVDPHPDRRPKQFMSDLARRILAEGGKSVLELKRAGIEMKTIRLKATGRPREAMSFPNFSHMGIVNENWEESDFCARLESRFLFVVFKVDESGVERLHAAFYWNMPHEDRLEAQRVWEETRRRVSIDPENLPGAKESWVAHVRPKARNSMDVEATPTGVMVPKKCFWLNQSYIKDVVEQNS